MVSYLNKSFEGGIVQLDGNEYRSCTFNNVVLEFCGGEFVFADNTVGLYVLSFRGDFARGLKGLRNLVEDIGLGAAQGVADQLAASIRPDKAPRNADLH